MDYAWKNYNFVLDRNGIPQLLEEPERWKITFIDTGTDTMTGGRIQQARQYIGEETFLLTYGDGLANIDIRKLLDFHRQKGKIATVTGISKKSQYGTLVVENNLAVSFQEKSQIEGIINGGFFVFNKEIFDYLKDDSGCILEQEPMINLAKDRQLAVYSHDGFWTAMDTYKDIQNANEIWKNGNCLWKVW